MCSTIAFWIWGEAIKNASPEAVACSMHLKTPVAIFLGVLIGNEHLSSHFYFGTFFIIAGVFLSSEIIIRTLKIILQKIFSSKPSYIVNIARGGSK